MESLDGEVDIAALSQRIGGGWADAQGIGEKSANTAVHRAFGNMNESCQWLRTIEVRDEKRYFCKSYTVSQPSNAVSRLR